MQVNYVDSGLFLFKHAHVNMLAQVLMLGLSELYIIKI